MHRKSRHEHKMPGVRKGSVGRASKVYVGQGKMKKGRKR